MANTPQNEAGADDRAAGLSAQGQGDVEIRHRRGGSAGRAAWGPGEIVGIAGRRRTAGGGEFHCVGLAQDQGARLPQQGHAGGVSADEAATIEIGIILGGHILGKDDVLDADRQPVQRSPVRPGVERAGGL